MVPDSHGLVYTLIWFSMVQVSRAGLALIPLQILKYLGSGLNYLYLQCHSDSKKKSNVQSYWGTLYLVGPMKYLHLNRVDGRSRG